MRPNTLTEVSERVQQGEMFDKALDEFLDQFYGSKSAAEAAQRITAEPPKTGKRYFDAYLAAAAEYLSVQYLRQAPPNWVRAPYRIMHNPAFTVKDATPGMKEWLAFQSPAEFRNHNIFTEEVPLRRKLSSRVNWHAENADIQISEHR